MRMLLNILIINTLVLIFTAEANVPTPVVNPVIPAKIKPLPKEWIIDVNLSKVREVV